VAGRRAYICSNKESGSDHVDNSQLLPLLGGVVVGGVLGAGGLYAWLSGRLKQEAQRHHQAEQARQLSAQQVTQARKQIEQLQRENHELRLAVRPAPRPAPPPEPAIDAAEAARRYAESKLKPPEPAEQPKAFKDTVVLPRGQ
jgi:hypothetical protein